MGEANKYKVSKKEAIAFLQNLINELNTQDNVGTAKPLIHSIRHSKKLPAPDDSSDDYEWIDSAGDSIASSDEEAVSLLESDGVDVVNKWDLDDLMDTHFEATRVFNQKVDVHKGAFLTREAAESHLSSNRHHYGDDAG